MRWAVAVCAGVLARMTRTGASVGRLLVWALAAAAALSASAAVSQHDAVSVILDKATAYVAEYVKTLSSLVSEERYEQRVTREIERGRAPAEKESHLRTLVSDYLLVQIPGSKVWAPFRDVYSVDGVPVRDRSDRLLKLFLEPSATATARAYQIRAESSRYNIGTPNRDTNVPTLALEVLGADLRGGFTFKQRGHQTVDGTDTVVIEYSETARPTMIRGRNYEDVPATGRFWIRPDTGCVMRSVLETRPKDLRTKIEVTYRYEPSLGVVVPSEMIERHDLVQEVVDGKATYSKIRRFRVETSVEIKIK
jgi:hypothetical protein